MPRRGKRMYRKAHEGATVQKPSNKLSPRFEFPRTCRRPDARNLRYVCRPDDAAPSLPCTFSTLIRLRSALTTSYSVLHLNLSVIGTSASSVTTSGSHGARQDPSFWKSGENSSKTGANAAEKSDRANT
jgi:hypothetical protein